MTHDTNARMDDQTTGFWASYAGRDTWIDVEARAVTVGDVLLVGEDRRDVTDVVRDDGTVTIHWTTDAYMGTITRSPYDMLIVLDV